MEKKLRKYQNLLVEAGTGMILFAVWGVAKVNLYLGLSAFPMDEFHSVAMELGLNETFFLIFMVVLVASVLILQLSIQLYIGFSAIAEGKGKRKSWFYFVVTLVFFVTTMQTNWQAFGVDQILAGEPITADLIMSICVELVAAYVMLELLISGIRVKILRRKLKV